MHKAIAVLLALSLINACSSFSPQIFSERLVLAPAGAQQPSGDPGVADRRSRITVREAISEAQDVQRKYITSIADLSEITPRTSAALIALSAVTTFKGVTGGNQKDIAGAGLLGGAAYLIANSLVSQPRQRVYLEGARALNCAISATRPWGVPDAEALESELQEARTALIDLGLVLDQFRDAMQPMAMPAPPATQRPKGCARRPKCPASVNASADLRSSLAQACREQAAAWDAQCGVAAPTATILVANRQTRAAFSAASKELKAGAAAIADAAPWLDQINQAGGRLYDKNVEVQLTVAQEVMKTEPNLGAVLGAIANLRDIGGRLSGATLLAEPKTDATAVVQAGTSAKDKEAEPDLKAIEALQKATRRMAFAREGLTTWTLRMKAIAKEAQGGLVQCQVAGTVSALRVNPDVDSLSLKAGNQQVFYVAGGTGMPTGTVSGQGKGTPGTLARILDAQGHFGFTYKPDPSAVGGDEARIRFSDASGSAVHDVAVLIVGTTTAATDPAALVSADWVALGFSGTSAPPQASFTERLKQCQARMTDGHAQDGVYDKPTKDFVRAASAPCKALT